MSDPKSDHPFAKLAAMREQLPAGPAPTEAHKADARERRLFGEKVVVRHTRKGHGGKTVTVVSGVLPHALDDLASQMKRAFGCGARVEDGAIVLQGELVERAVGWLEKQGAKKVVRGS